nr:BTAD domain-containing putative transcriptional regulator [Kibdelosporangium sp. MJ126-NF4]CTQ98325.1 transcriptional regulator, SARP family [Kibdelosporangium sp. MJ126-NF4]
MVVPPGHQRVLLSSLLLSAGVPVRGSALAAQLWGDRPPVNVRGALSTYVTRLRGILGKQAIASYPGGGYLLAVDEDAVDLHRFRRLLVQAREAEGTDDELPLLREGLRLWRGRPFTGVDSEWVDQDVVPSLTEEWFVATERRIDLDIARGASRELVVELSQLVTSYPLREPLWARLIDALYRTGRRADALATYQQVREILRDDLGIDPGEHLQALHQDVLRDVLAVEPVRPVEQVMSAPHQLPPDNIKFVGRQNELADLARLVDDACDDSSRSTVIVAVDGAPGTGKTTLAVHWAHRMAHRYPDVQLYLNLRGHAGDDPVGPLAAIEAVLRSLGVPTERIPPDLDERSALLRSTLTGRKSLILLDNARDASQVRALLPSADSLVIVTSRNQLRALCIRDGAQRLSLSRLTEDDSLELLGTAIGAEKVAAEPQAARQLAALCDGLPLALAIVAERAQRADTLSQVSQALVEEMRGPDTFGSGMGKELYAALSWSYRTLEPAAAAMFRKLGMHPTGDISTNAAAALAGVPVTRAKYLLDQLVDAHMVEQRQPSRYEVHELIRLYAAEETRRAECVEDRQATVRRVLDWYLCAAVSADTVLEPARLRQFVAACEPCVRPPRFAHQGEAIAWFEGEFDCLRSVVRWAATHGWEGHAWRIVIAMTTFLDRRVAWGESAEILQTVLKAARSADDRVGEGYALNSLACLQIDKGELALARDNLEQAVDCFKDEGHPGGELMAVGNLGLVLAQVGEPEHALRLCTNALDLAERLGHRRGVANNLNNMGTAHVAMGDHKRAIDCFLEAEQLFDEVDDVEPGLINIHDLGCAYAATEQHAESIRALRRAVDGYQRLGSRRWWAVTLIDLGKAISDAGHPGWARAPWAAALEVMRELVDPRADELAKLLTAVPG